MMVVSLLSSSPKNGVEIMDGVEQMTRGWWRPTAGSIYPLLNTMVDEGTIKKREADGRYELTSKAKKELEYSFGPGFPAPRGASDVVKEASSFVSYLQDLAKTRPKDLKPREGELRDMMARLGDVVSRVEAEKDPES
jgi:DNA-binding PadR family transcriptional regulator